MKTELNFAIPTKALKAAIHFAAIGDIRSCLNGVHVAPGMIESTDGYVIARIKDGLITIDGATDHIGRPADIIIPIEQAKALNDKVTREDLWRQAAKEVGVPEKDIPTGSSRGKETFFNGIVYDPENPQAYLDSLKIKK